MRFTSTNVTSFTIELIMAGGDPTWAENISVFSTILTDGTHEILVDFSNVQPISTETWGYVNGHFIKDYQIVAIKLVLDTGSQEELNGKDATLVLHDLTFLPVL